MNPEETKQIFERMAAGYDRHERAAVAHAIAAAMRPHLPVGAGLSALDFGCGTGLVGLSLADAFEALWLMDNSPEMIRQVESKIKAAGIANAHAVQGDILEDDIPLPQFDCIVAAQVFLHIVDILPVLVRLHSLLKPGGRLLIADFDHTEGIESDKVHPGFDQHAFIQTVKDAGFITADARTFYRGEQLFMNREASMFLLVAGA